MADTISSSAWTLLQGEARGPIVATTEPLSFWGGVDPTTARVVDVHHPLKGVCVAGAVVMMPSSRGSCTGSGVLLDLALADRAPAALIFSDVEDVLTLGALVAKEMFDKNIPVLRLAPEAFRTLAQAKSAKITATQIIAEGLTIPLTPPATHALDLSDADRAKLSGSAGPAVAQAMRIICAMAVNQGARKLIDVGQGHIDGCIYAAPANLVFAEAMAKLGATVCIPTTMNAISVDREHWRDQGVPLALGDPAARLADAYVRMGCRPTFTCSPYLLSSAPQAGDMIAWSESNAVIFANSVLGARTAKHPDFLDLCIALTGRAPLAGAYLDEGRKARRILAVERPEGADESFWPLLGLLAGRASPDRVPLLTGLETSAPSRDDLKALCAAFGTTSAAPMLHIAGVTPEAEGAAGPDADFASITRAALKAAWTSLNAGPAEVQLVAVGSPHASLSECRALADALKGRPRREDVAVIVTAGRDIIAQARHDGALAKLEASGVRVLPDLCWCSISEPVFPPATRTVMTNSGKYAHYGPGLSGRGVRFGSLADCATAAVTGRAAARLPEWLT